VRPTGMMRQRQVRELAVAGLLCAALAGCGSVVASTSAGAPATSTTNAGTPATTAPQVGCASVNQATEVTIRRIMRVVVPVAKNPVTVIESKPTLVRALFRDFCSAVTHPDNPKWPISCPADFGTDYLGTFYDGGRVLATFTFAWTGCQRVSVTAAGKTQATMVFGRAAAAAPHIVADMDAVLGLNQGVIQPQANPGGPDKAA